MSDTNKEKITPGGIPDTQGNPLSSEIGLMDSGGDQSLRYHNYFNQSQDMLGICEGTKPSTSEKNILDPFQRSQKLNRSPAKVTSPSLGSNIKLVQQKESLLLKNKEHQKNELPENCNSSVTEKLYSELCKANSALFDSTNLNKQLNQTIAWMQERIKLLENEVSALKSKEAINPQANILTPVQEYHTDEEELARETEFVRVINRRKKRKRNNTPSPPQLQLNVPKVISKKPEKVPQPPPIVINDVKDYDLLYDKIKTITESDRFNAKVMSGNNIKINLKDGESYRQLTKVLNQEKHSWHTFEDKQTRPIRVMAKNLHYTCKREKIIDDLKAQGFKAVDASIKLNRRNKTPLNMFMLTFDTDEIIEKIYQIKYILGCKVIIQPLRRSKLIPQCHQCQAYGHTQKYCNQEARCVKCIGKHHTRDCVLPKNAQPKCVHCGENHPANYRGCSVAIELQNIKFKGMKEKKLIRKPTIRENKPEIIRRTVTETSQEQMGNVTYAQILRSKAQHRETSQSDDVNRTLQLILSKLNTFDERLNTLEYRAKGAIPKQRNGQRS